MEHTTTVEIQLGDEPDEVVTQRAGDFVRHFALGTAAIYALFSVAIMLAEPELVLVPAVWVLWAVVTAAAALTYELGRYVHRRPRTARQPGSRDPSLQTHRWTVG